MKKQFLALIGGVMVAGLAMAAEVVGNNEAVVIQKAKVESATGFQFLCVPVAPLDITGGTTGELKLSAVLPPELYTIGTTVTRTEGGSSVSYTVQLKTVESVEANHWCNSSGDVVDTTEDNAVVLESGEIFWLNSKSAFGWLSTETEESPIVFCGQAIKDAGVVTGDKGNIIACANNSSKAKTLGTLITDATPNSTVYAIAEGTTDYKTYTYIKFDSQATGAWYTRGENGGALVDASNVEIAAGEAFYYLKK